MDFRLFDRIHWDLTRLIFIPESTIQDIESVMHNKWSTKEGRRAVKQFQALAKIYKRIDLCVWLNARTSIHDLFINIFINDDPVRLQFLLQFCKSLHSEYLSFFVTLNSLMVHHAMNGRIEVLKTLLLSKDVDLISLFCMRLGMASHFSFPFDSLILDHQLRLKFVGYDQHVIIHDYYEYGNTNRYLNNDYMYSNGHYHMVLSHKSKQNVFIERYKGFLERLYSLVKERAVCVIQAAFRNALSDPRTHLYRHMLSRHHTYFSLHLKN